MSKIDIGRVAKGFKPCHIKACADNVIIAVETGSSIILAGKEGGMLEPKGVLIDAGVAAKTSCALVGSVVYFNPSQERTRFGNPETDTVLYVVIPEFALQCVEHGAKQEVSHYYNEVTFDTAPAILPK